MEKKGGGKIRKGGRKLLSDYYEGQVTLICNTGKSTLSRFPWYQIF